MSGDLFQLLRGLSEALEEEIKDPTQDTGFETLAQKVFGELEKLPPEKGKEHLEEVRHVIALLKTLADKLSLRQDEIQEELTTLHRHYAGEKQYRRIQAMGKK